MNAEQMKELGWLPAPEVTYMETVPVKTIDELAEHILIEREKIIKTFLKMKGYRPTDSKHYARDLKYRLRRKGLELVCEITQHPFDDKTLTYSETYRVFFKPYERK